MGWYMTAPFQPGQNFCTRMLSAVKQLSYILSNSPLLLNPNSKVIPKLSCNRHWFYYQQVNIHCWLCRILIIYFYESRWSYAAHRSVPELHLPKTMRPKKIIFTLLIVALMTDSVLCGLGSDLLGAVGLTACLAVCHTCCVACLAAAGFTGGFDGGNHGMSMAAPQRLPQNPAIAACIATFQACDQTCRNMH